MFLQVVDTVSYPHIFPGGDDGKRFRYSLYIYESSCMLLWLRETLMSRCFFLILPDVSLVITEVLENIVEFVDAL